MPILTIRLERVAKIAPLSRAVTLKCLPCKVETLRRFRIEKNQARPLGWGLSKVDIGMIQNTKLILSVISIMLLYVLSLILVYRWLIQEYIKSQSMRLTLSIANGFITFFIFSTVLFARFLPTHNFNIILMTIGVSGIIGALLGFIIHKYHTKQLVWRSIAQKR